MGLKRYIFHHCQRIDIFWNISIPPYHPPPGEPDERPKICCLDGWIQMSDHPSARPSDKYRPSDLYYFSFADTQSVCQFTPPHPSSLVPPVDALQPKASQGASPGPARDRPPAGKYLTARTLRPPLSQGTIAGARPGPPPCPALPCHRRPAGHHRARRTVGDKGLRLTQVC